MVKFFINDIYLDSYLLSQVFDVLDVGEVFPDLLWHVNLFAINIEFSGGCFSIVCDLQNVFNSMLFRKVNNGAPFHAIATITVPNVLHVLFLCAGGAEWDPGGAERGTPESSGLRQGSRVS